MRPIHLYSCVLILGAALVTSAYLIRPQHDYPANRYQFIAIANELAGYRIDTQTGRVEIKAGAQSLEFMAAAAPDSARKP